MLIEKVSSNEGQTQGAESRWQLTTVSDDNLLFSLAWLVANSLDGRNNIHAIHYRAKYHMLPIQPGGGE